MEKEISVLALAPGKKPRDVTLRNSIEAVAEFLGGPVEGVPVLLNDGYASIVMLSRVADLDAAERNPDWTGIIPGPSVLCCVEGNDLIPLPPAYRETFLRDYETLGDMALTVKRVRPMLRVRVAGTSDKAWRDFLSRIGMGKGGVFE